MIVGLQKLVDDAPIVSIFKQACSLLSRIVAAGSTPFIPHKGERGFVVHGRGFSMQMRGGGEWVTMEEEGDLMLLFDTLLNGEPSRRLLALQVMLVRSPYLLQHVMSTPRGPSLYPRQVNPLNLMLLVLPPIRFAQIC